MLIFLHSLHLLLLTCSLLKLNETSKPAQEPKLWRGIRVILITSQKLMFWEGVLPHFRQFQMFERSSGVGTPSLVNWSGGVWLWPRGSYINSHSLSNIWDHNLRCLQPKSNAFLNFTIMVGAPIPVCDLLWTLEIKCIGHEAYVKCSKKINNKVEA